jgi:hypothetical protein
LTLAHVAQKGKNESARITAASMLLDRGYGRPAQSIEMKMLLDKRISELTDAELAALEARLAALPDEEESDHVH